MSAPALKAAHSAARAFLPYGRQLIEDDDIAAVADALRGDFLTTGPSVARFETALAKAVSAKHARVCANGTAALYLAARALGLGAGSTIVVPAITFLATASAPRLNGAEIVFADVDPDTGLMGTGDLERALRRAGRADAVFNVHLNGQCGDVEGIARLARSHGALVVDDSCHALGAAYIAEDGTASAIGSNTFADASVFSFHPVKAIAMGEGGAVTTNDDAVAERLSLVRNHGMTRDARCFENRDDAFDPAGEPNPWYYELVEPGFNWRATDIQCALGLSQLGKLGRFVARRRAIAATYDSLFAPFAPAIRPVARVRRCLPAWHLYVVRIDFSKMPRAELMHRLAQEEIGAQVHYFPVHRQPYFAKRYGALELPGADRYYAQALSLPLHAGMTQADAEYVVQALSHILGLQ
ncbi:MAG TPA: UDP-4-amino-4,6-dideoxy-N-acetyl-beta-L-altrosamine transaminase [Rhizomicrobium sp.]